MLIVKSNGMTIHLPGKEVQKCENLKPTGKAQRFRQWAPSRLLKCDKACPGRLWLGQGEGWAPV